MSSHSGAHLGRLWRGARLACCKSWRPPLLLGAALLAWTANAQRVDDNAVTAAEDAFGSTLGSEKIGLYTTSEVRGFSPVAAGNVRVEGLYFDQHQTSLPVRLIEGSTIHVGVSAQGYPFPAPTGIVDHRLHESAGRRVFSLVTGLNAYLAPTIEVDAKLPIVPSQLEVAGGLSFSREEYYEGSDARYWRAALAPRWRPSEDIEVIPFWAHTRGRDEETAPTIATAGAYLPPQIERRHYFGQQWADNESDDTVYGTLVKARIGANWALAGGLFRSVADMPRGFADVYAGTQRDGSTRELIFADPPQRYASTSGELRVSRGLAEAARLHTVHFSVRARDQDNAYGGSTLLDLGPRLLGQRIEAPRPDRFEFGERTRDEVRQWTVGVGYEGGWRDVGEATFGVQRTDYEKRVEQPGLVGTATVDRPWLLSATVAGYLSPSTALFAGYTRGLEDSGVAPDNAANRNEALPAIRTTQMDVGVRWKVRPELQLVADLFEVEKPYFTTNESNVFTTVGQVSHRGLEFSLKGELSKQISAVLGAVLMEPRVSGAAVAAGRVGREPVGQTDLIVKANLEYRSSFAPLSFDVAVSNYGARIASTDNHNRVSGYALIDVGMRYRMTVANAPATLRIQVANLTDAFRWQVVGSNSFGLMDERRFSALLFVDF